MKECSGPLTTRDHIIYVLTGPSALPTANLKIEEQLGNYYSWAGPAVDSSLFLLPGPAWGMLGVSSLVAGLQG